MKKLLLAVIGIAVFFTACRQPQPQTGTRIVFDAGGQRVITHSVNKRQETMSILYGNAPAYAAALSGNGLHRAGERYTFVTWKYHDNPMYYGSKINGELISVEALQFTPAGQIDYQVMRGKVPPVNGRPLDRESRIRYLLEYRPSIMP